jgi:hypothetical protein
MSLGLIHQQEHLHLWFKSIDGAEYANAIYENEIDAAIAFTGIVVNIRKYDPSGITIAIEDVMQSLKVGKGMYAGYPGLVVVLSRCDGGCNSPSWN